MVTASVITGKEVSIVGLEVPPTRMVLTSSAGSLGSSGIAKLIRSGPSTLGVTFASWMAALKVH